MQEIGLDMVSNVSFWHSLPVSKSQQAQVSVAAVRLAANRLAELAAFASSGL